MAEEKLIKDMSEREYRQLSLPSYSSIKDFIHSRLGYYKKYILLEKGKDDETKEQDKDDMRFGNIVDCLKFTFENFENRYQLSTAKKPTGQMLDFVEEMQRLTIKNTNDSGVLCMAIERIMEDSYNQLIKDSKTGKLRDSFPKFQERFLTNKEGYDYYLELKNRGNKIILSTEELEWAQSIVEYMNNHPFTRDLMNLQPSEKYDIQDQMKMIGKIGGLDIKGMLDRTIFNKVAKVITPLDLKVMSNNTLFPYNYLKLSYYIQNAVYTSLLRQNYPGWTVKPLAFVTIDKYRQNDPIIIRTSEQQYQEAIKGFIIDGKKYKGLLEAVDELQWHNESGIWTTSKEIHINHGYCDLRLNNYEQ